MKNYKMYCYHGTKKSNIEGILKNGFKKGTYFSLHLEDAREYGGNYIFRVGFNSDLSIYDWQFRVDKRIPPSRIISLHKITIKSINI